MVWVALSSATLKPKPDRGTMGTGLGVIG